MEALEVYTDPTKIHHRRLQIHVLTIDRIVGPLTSPFFVVSANLAPRGSDTSGKESLRIKEEG